MARPSPARIPTDLRPRLEAARLDLLALFRALDQIDLTPTEIPQRLIRQLFELDADYVDALWALDQPVGKLDLHAVATRHAGRSGTTASSLRPAPQAPSIPRSCRPRYARGGHS